MLILASWILIQSIRNFLSDISVDEVGFSIAIGYNSSRNPKSLVTLTDCRESHYILRMNDGEMVMSKLWVQICKMPLDLEVYIIEMEIISQN
jgi:hypothetical protein